MSKLPQGWGNFDTSVKVTPWKCQSYPMKVSKLPQKGVKITPLVTLFKHYIDCNINWI